MKKYRLNTFRLDGPAIESIEIERETEHSVWVNGRRHPKDGGRGALFDSFEEAKEKAIAGLERQLELQQERIGRTKRDIAALRGQTLADDRKARGWW